MSGQFAAYYRVSTDRQCRSGLGRAANCLYDDPHKLLGRFDFVMANPPFNQPEVDRAKLVNEAGKVDPRFGLPTNNNANYIWINLFYAARQFLCFSDLRGTHRSL